MPSVSPRTQLSIVDENVPWSMTAVFGTETSATASLPLLLLDCCRGHLVFRIYVYTHTHLSLQQTCIL